MLFFLDAVQKDSGQLPFEGHSLPGGVEEDEERGGWAVRSRHE